MKPAPIIHCAVTVLSLMWLIPQASAQKTESDICLLEHLNATQISGHVVAVSSKKEAERPLPGALVELRRIGEQDVLEKTLTDEQGNFEFRNIAVGSYSLAARPPASVQPALFATVVEVRLGKAKTGKQTREIVLALGWQFDGCHGAYAEVRKKPK